ncbi:MAG: hypothetical protein KGI98_15610 [Euryarchaeota archaeon]|nr:hypothetical protein [Euryarchaeota archaeon]
MKETDEDRTVVYAGLIGDGEGIALVERFANARLIAAAPTLLEALRQLTAAVERMGDPNEAGECFDLLPTVYAALDLVDGEK